MLATHSRRPAGTLVIIVRRRRGQRVHPPCVTRDERAPRMTLDYSKQLLQRRCYSALGAARDWSASMPPVFWARTMKIKAETSGTQ